MGKLLYNMISIRKILMDNLIKELESPKYLAPSPAALRAVKVIKELITRAETDTRVRILAEQKLTAAEAEVARLTQELIDVKKNNVNNSTMHSDNSGASAP